VLFSIIQWRFCTTLQYNIALFYLLGYYLFMRLGYSQLRFFLHPKRHDVASDVFLE